MMSNITYRILRNVMLYQFVVQEAVPIIMFAYYIQHTITHALHTVFRPCENRPPEDFTHTTNHVFYEKPILG